MDHQNFELNVDNLLKDLEAPRTVSEMEAYYNKIIDTIRESRELIQLCRIRKGRFKEFFEEYVPLYKFAKSEYGYKNCKYNIVIGNQQYDGVIQGPCGCRKIEISKYQDGYVQNRIAKELNENGAAMTPGGDVEKLLDIYFDNFMRCVYKKKEKRYMDTDIVFVVDASVTWPYLFAFNRDEFINRLIQGISEIFQGSAGIYLLVEMQGETIAEDLMIKVY